MTYRRAGWRVRLVEPLRNPDAGFINGMISGDAVCKFFFLKEFLRGGCLLGVVVKRRGKCRSEWHDR